MEGEIQVPSGTPTNNPSGLEHHDEDDPGAGAVAGLPRDQQVALNSAASFVSLLTQVELGFGPTMDTFSTNTELRWLLVGAFLFARQAVAELRAARGLSEEATTELIDSVEQSMFEEIHGGRLLGVLGEMAHELDERTDYRR
jgi:hypothetical protein